MTDKSWLQFTIIFEKLILILLGRWIDEYFFFKTTRGHTHQTNQMIQNNKNYDKKKPKKQKTNQTTNWMTAHWAVSEICLWELQLISGWHCCLTTRSWVQSLAWTCLFVSVLLVIVRFSPTDLKHIYSIYTHWSSMLLCCNCREIVVKKYTFVFSLKSERLKQLVKVKDCGPVQLSEGSRELLQTWWDILEITS